MRWVESGMLMVDRSMEEWLIELFGMRGGVIFKG